MTPDRDPRIVTGSDYGNPDPEWKRIGWSRRRRSVELAAAKVNYVEIGEGEPILFLHGISGCWQNWLENLPHFGADRRAIALDLPGFGSSPMPSWPIDMPAYGRLVLDFCERLGLERVTLVGNSMGGFIATEMVTADRPLRAPRPRLRRRDPQHPEPGSAGDRHRLRLEATRAGRRRPGPLDRSRRLSRELTLAPFFRYPSRLRPELLLEQMAGGARCPAFRDALRALIRYDIRERLGAIEMPALIVWGLSDRVIPVSAAISYHRRIPHSRLEIFERTGHLPQLERPLRFNALLDEFLAE